MLRFVEKVTLSFAPLNASSRSIRSLLGRVYTKNNLQENPKCAVTIQASEKIKYPSLEVVYNDKKVLKLDTGSMTSDEIVREMNRHSKLLKTAEDMKS
ncbi:hypothetical protein BJ742DRAFT_807048 [Cladochytrium replicatum]|nr:hypothetical protein BJ742DRAFT_807048 [Cladochytrium replicatum]